MAVCCRHARVRGDGDPRPVEPLARAVGEAGAGARVKVLRVDGGAGVGRQGRGRRRRRAGGGGGGGRSSAVGGSPGDGDGGGGGGDGGGGTLAIARPALYCTARAAVAERRALVRDAGVLAVAERAGVVRAGEGVVALVVVEELDKLPATGNASAGRPGFGAPVAQRALVPIVADEARKAIDQARLAAVEQTGLATYDVYGSTLGRLKRDSSSNCQTGCSRRRTHGGGRGGGGGGVGGGSGLGA